MATFLPVHHFLSRVLLGIGRRWATPSLGTYLLAIFFVLMALAARAVLDPFLNLDVPFLTFFLAVTASAWYGGLGPGIFAVGASTLLASYFFIPPIGSFLIPKVDMVAVGLFAAEAMGLAYLTDRFRQSNREVWASHEKVTRLLESITDAYVVLDKDWIYTEVNARAEALLGRPANDLIGRNVWQLFPQAVGTTAWLELHQAMTARMTKRFEIYSKPLDRWFENRVYPHGEGLTIMLADITERKRTEQAWHETESRLAAFLEQAPVGIGLLNLEGRAVVANPLFRHYIHDVIPSRSGIDVWRWRAWRDDGQLLEAAQWPGARALRGETVTGVDFLYQADSGTESWVRVSSAPFRDQSDTVLGVILVLQDIDERKRAEEALRDSQERFARFMQYLPGLAWIKDNAGRYVFVNEAAQKAFGLEHPHLLWKTDEQLLGVEKARQFRRTDDIVLASGSPLETIEILEQHGDRRHSLVHKFLIPGPRDGTVMIGGMAMDVTPHRRAEEALRASEERLRMAMAAGQMGAWEIDLESGRVIWDAKQYELFGVPSDAPPTTMDDFYALVHPDDEKRVKEAAAATELTGYFAEEFRIVRPDGRIRWLASRGATLTDQNGRSVRMVGVNYDITERKEAQDRLERFAEELERKVAERTQELVSSQEQLRALATELNLAEQRERKRLATELHDYLAQTLVLGRLKLGQTRQVPTVPPLCRDLIRQTEEVLNEALTYTRTLVADLSPPVLHDFGLPAALTWLGQQMERHELNVSVELRRHEGLKLPGDQAVLLFQSVRELLINAAKHAGSGAATVRLESREGALQIDVHDDGLGFVPEAVMSGPQKAAGTSAKFGLFSIRERMRALGGRFEITSEPGNGTTATIVLPLYEVSPRGQEQRVPGPASTEVTVRTQTSVNDSAVEDAETPARQDTISQSPTVRVLLVDDHAMVRQGLRSVLDTYPDIEIVGEAWNGEEAVACAGTLRPSVIVMDVNMPKMNGIEATAHIKARYPDMIVIGLSVNAGSDNHDAMKKAGAARLLTKEAAVEHLYSTIQEAVKNRVAP